jgi:hypothetical protein
MMGMKNPEDSVSRAASMGGGRGEGMAGGDINEKEGVSGGTPPYTLIENAPSAPAPRVPLTLTFTFFTISFPPLITSNHPMIDFLWSSVKVIAASSETQQWIPRRPE